VDAKVFAPKRRAKVAASAGSEGLDSDVELPLPYIVDTAQQIFPVIAFVLILRSFIYEPFQIPSGSMRPTLLVGDFILVEKFSYGLKDPVFRTKFLETGSPERGDVVVFKYPKSPNLDYIKRVIGLPGDTVTYSNKEVFITPACKTGENCAPKQKMDQISRGNFVEDGEMTFEQRFTEKLGEVEHDILINPRKYDEISNYQPQQYGTKLNQWIVPEGEYFVMGDNRDNSQDGRFWGFVPDENLVGKAVAIWISFEFKREADSMLPGWIPTGVRFNRVGGIQ
jgi:signal peptidase I